MKQVRLLTAICALSILFITGCKKEVTPENQEPQNELKAKSNGSAQEATGLSAELKQRIAKLKASLPADFALKIKRNSPLSIKQHPQYRAMVLKALGAVEPTPCGPTAIDLWLNEELADWTGEMINYIFEFSMTELPTYDAYVFENNSANQYFGADGEYTKQVTKTFRDIKRFWNIQSDDIVLVAMHGNMLQNRDKIIRTYVAVYNVPPATAAQLADIVLLLVKAIPQYEGGEHPIFTFNAFAAEGFSYPPYATIKDKIVMGDGILEAFTAIGYDDVAPQAILAHEFGHHIQFQLNLFEEVRTPEATRRTELMADAFAAYYLSHARGATMQWKRVRQFLQVFFSIGDCGFASTGHHGTPAQRMAAAEWGYRVADNAQKQGHILTAQQFTALFEKQLPILVAN